MQNSEKIKSINFDNLKISLFISSRVYLIIQKVTPLFSWSEFIPIDARPKAKKLECKKIEKKNKVFFSAKRLKKKVGQGGAACSVKNARKKN